MHKYKLISKKGEGTFSEVIKAQCIKNGKLVAIKRMKARFDSVERVNNLREIQALRRLSSHANIIKLLEVLYDRPTGRLALVFELMDMNIYEYIKGRHHYLPEYRIKNYIYQLLKSIDFMHRNGVFHRDIKPENILISDDVLKLADFGSCRGIYTKQPYTEYISTRWYRAPECLLTDGYYNHKMDVWGVGCCFFEIMALFPLFPGTNELDQVNKVHNVIGTPVKELLDRMKKFSRNNHMDFNFPAKKGCGLGKLIPHASADCVDLLTKLLTYNPDERISARQALRHGYFRDIREAEKRAQASKISPKIMPLPEGGQKGQGKDKGKEDRRENRGVHEPEPVQAHAQKRGAVDKRHAHDGGGQSNDPHRTHVPEAILPRLPKRHTKPVDADSSSASLIHYGGESRLPQNQQQHKSHNYGKKNTRREVDVKLPTIQHGATQDHRYSQKQKQQGSYHSQYQKPQVVYSMKRQADPSSVSVGRTGGAGYQFRQQAYGYQQHQRRAKPYAHQGLGPGVRSKAHRPARQITLASLQHRSTQRRAVF